MARLGDTIHSGVRIEAALEAILYKPVHSRCLLRASGLGQTA